MVNFLLSLWYKYKSWRYERKCIKYFGAKPEKIVVPQKDFDALVERLNQPPDPESMEKIKKVLERKSLWD